MKGQKSKVKLKTMKKLIFSLFCVLAIGVSVLLATPVGKRIPQSVAKAEILGTIEDSYKCGMSLTLPKTLVYEGKEYPASVILNTPTGKQYSASTYIIDELGVYTIVCTAQINGKTVVAEKSFKSESDFYEVSSSYSSCEYKEELLLTKKDEETGKGQKGIKVSLASGDEFRVNRPVDLNKNGGERYQFINFYPYSLSRKVEGMSRKSEAEKFIITLTDCYDESNYISFVIYYSVHGEYGRYPYYAASSYDSAHIGVEEFAGVFQEESTRKEVYIDGIRHIARINNNGTTGATRKYYETNEEGETVTYVQPCADDYGYKLSYEPATNRMYLEDTRVRLVSDLDDKELYGEKTFRGFTTGEVYVSVKGQTYLENYVNFEIDAFDGLQGDAFAYNECADNVAPRLEIFAPQGSLSIAQGESIRLFDYNCFDINLKYVQSAVYYNYGTEKQSKISVFDGVFTPNKIGNYTVEYTAEDVYGNKTVETVELNCVKTKSGKSIDFITEKLTTIQSGKEIVLPTYILKGINGSEYVKIYAVYGEEKTEISSENRMFLPLHTGEYEIIYEYGNGVVVYRDSYKVNSVASDSILYLEEPILPTYFITGSTYTIDKVYAYTFATQNPQEVLATAYVQEDGAEYKKIDYESYEVGARESVRFKFEYEGVTLITEVFKAIEVTVDGEDDGVDLKKYFVGDFEKNATEENITFVSNKKFGDNDLEFINAISLEYFTLNFLIPAKKANFKCLDVEIIDFYDRENKTVLTFRNGGSNYAISQNGGAEKLVSTTLTDTLKTITYAKGFVDVNSGKKFGDEIETKTDKILIRIVLRDIVGTSAIAISTLNNHTICNKTNDRVTPMLSVDNSSGVREIGDRIVIYPATVTDIVTPVAESNLSCIVKDPLGNYVMADCGTMLNGIENSAVQRYTFSLTEYGTYRVTYNVYDQNGNVFVYSYMIYAYDMQAPTLQFNEIENGEMLNEKAGATVTLCNYQVSDNYSEPKMIECFFVAFTPKGEAIYLNKATTFVLTEKGKWTINLYVYDEAGNFVMATYYILAS